MKRPRHATAMVALVPAFVVCVRAPALAQVPDIPPQPLSIAGAVTHVYKSIDGVDLRLHVFTPPNHSARTPRPAIVFFFGGGWTNGTVEQFVPQSKHLSGRGMVAIVADYRVSARHKTTPFDAVADAQSAITWVRSHAKELGIDPTRIAAGGGSSGGHIASSAAVFGTGGDSKPSSLVLFNPAVDISRLAERFGPRWKDISPVHHLDGDLPPMVIFHGKMDTTVPYAEVERFCLESKKHGNRCELIGFDGATHGFFNPTRENGKWYRETLLEADRFLTKLGYISAPSPDKIAP